MLIAHLSDPHMRAAGQLYQGLVDTNALFDLALETLAALDPAPDLVIIGGDLVDDGSDADYATVAGKLSRIAVPVFAIPGNHDERGAFRRCLPGLAGTASGPLHFRAEGELRVIGFDVTVPGAHHGEVDDDKADWLDAALSEAPDHPTMVLMHQPPILSGIDCIDAYNCRGGDLLAGVLARHHQVERLLCGHVHRFMQTSFAGIPLLCAPATSTSIALRLGAGAEPASYLEPPAMLLHDWRGPGRLVTHHLSIGRYPGPFPFF